MNSILIIIVFVASLFFYSTSKDTNAPSKGIMGIITKLSQYGYLIGGLLLLVGTFISIHLFGSTSGVIFLLLLLLIFLSLIIVVYPLKVINSNYLFIAIIIALLIELTTTLILE